MADLYYEVSFKGVASITLRGAFAGYELGSGPGSTLVRCPHDALPDVMSVIEDFGLDVLDVRLLAARGGRSPALG